ncbi:hypothetical protein [Streptococcus suis]|uniref:Uncharacterized protein n=1 Tax=Streptococcus suis TaxID=1307 RepID=A0A9X4MPQ1_STRSU|nr:hypothetical protein [Streptococcus suis]MDG4516430.1 hypothetical protein [Streptococcus suis]MDG4522591.1 hypothetical protein [Streptococcus suis]
MIDDVLMEKIVSIIVGIEMKCKKILLSRGHFIDIVSDYYYLEEDFALISFSRNNDKLTIRLENQQCFVTLENEIFTVTSEIIEEDIEIQIKILIKQAILGKWKMFMNDVKNSSLLEAIQNHRFDDYSTGPDTVIDF